MLSKLCVTRFAPFHWVLAISLLILTGCGTAPTVPYSPSMPLPPQPPAKVKPLSDMLPIAKPPAPVFMSLLPPAQQAREAFIMYQEMAAYAGKCTVTRQTLIDWINQF